MIVYICSPYRGETPGKVQEHVEYARELTKDALMRGYAPITPHLYITQCVDDADGDERRMGMRAGLELLGECNAIIVGCRHGISEGMEEELKWAELLNIPVIHLDTEGGAGMGEEREDLSAECDKLDWDPGNDCYRCSYFKFPHGCTCHGDREECGANGAGKAV